MVTLTVLQQTLQQLNLCHLCWLVQNACWDTSVRGIQLAPAVVVQPKNQDMKEKKSEFISHKTMGQLGVCWGSVDQLRSTVGLEGPVRPETPGLFDDPLNH